MSLTLNKHSHAAAQQVRESCAALLMLLPL